MGGGDIEVLLGSVHPILLASKEKRCHLTLDDGVYGLSAGRVDYICAVGNT